MKDDIKPVTDLTERELQERMCDLMTKQEKHLKYFSNVLTAFLFLTVLGIGLYIAQAMAEQ